MGNETSEPDFSNVQGTVRSAPSDAPARADFSNVESKVDSTPDEATNYVVEKGDSLSKIAKHFYGSANAWKSIFDANRDQISDPDLIKPGQILKIPPQS